MIKKLIFLIAMVLMMRTAHADLSQYTASKVQRAHNLQQEEKLDDAITLLAGLRLSKAYDQAFVKRMLGVLYWQQGNTDKAIANLSDAVKSGLLKDEQSWLTHRMLADLLLSDEQFKQALPHYYQLLKNVPEEQKADELWLRVSQSHYQLQEWKPVLAAISTYESLTTVDTVAPLNIKLGAQLQLKYWKSAISTLKRLIMLEPNKTIWWQQMAGIQLRLGRPSDALDTMALAKRQGVALSQQDLKTLAQLYAQRGIPEQAALIYTELEGANTDAELVSSQAVYWQMAKEWDKAISVWTLAARLDNKHRWQLAQLLLQEGHYRNALIELDKVGQPSLNADVELAKVRAYYKLKNYEQAIIHAKRANTIKSTSASKSWIKYLSQIRKIEG